MTPIVLAVVAAVCAGTAVALGLRRPLSADVDSASIGVFGRVLKVGWLAGRADGLSWPDRLVLGSAAGVGCGWLVNGFGRAGPWTSLVAGAVCAVGIAVLAGHLEPQRVRRRRQELSAAAPQALDMLAVCLTAGLPLRSALGAVVEVSEGPLAEDLGQVLSLVDLGVGDADAWRSLATHPELGAAASELARSVDSGTMLVESLTAHAAEARARRVGAVEVAARRVGVRSVLPLMTCFIPAFLLIGIVPTVVSAVLSAFSL